MIINIKHRKPYGRTYDCYYNNVKVKKKKCIDLPISGTIRLVEQSILLYRFWWLFAIFNLLMGIIGTSYYDWKNERIKQRIISINYKNILSNVLVVEVSNKGEDIIVYGVESFLIESAIDKVNPLIERRIKIARGILIVVPLILLTIIFVLLAVVSIG